MEKIERQRKAISWSKGVFVLTAPGIAGEGRAANRNLIWSRSIPGEHMGQEDAV